MHRRIELSRITNVTILITLGIALLYFAKGILVPLALALFTALLLYPVCDWLEKKHVPRIIAILLTFLAVVALVGGIGYFFSTQLIGLFDNLRDFGNRLENLFKKVILVTDEFLTGFNFNLKDITNSAGGFLSSQGLIEKTLTSSTQFIASFLLTVVYTFLFLLYRTSFKRFILFHFSKGPIRSQVRNVIVNIQKVAKNYFYGLFTVILILGALNGTGLWIIGLDYPYLFGYFAAFLAVIPYIGTFIGGLIPATYALIYTDTLWTPLMVVALYSGIQALEGNILTPKIVGSKVSINPLFALIALITGGFLWGIAGMVLFIPSLAILKVIFDQVDSLKPYGALLSSDFGDKNKRIFQKISNKFGRPFEKKSGLEENKEPDSPSDRDEHPEHKMIHG